MPSLASVHWVNLVIAIFTLISYQQSHSSLLIGVGRYLDSATIDRDPTTESNTVERKYIQDGAMVTIRYNWHQYTERQTIYNIYIINSSNEIMSLLEYQLFSLWDIYPPPSFVFFFFLFSFRLSDTSLLGAIAGEASKNSIKFAGIWRKSLFLILILGQIYSGIKNSCLLTMRKSLMSCIMEFGL